MWFGPQQLFVGSSIAWGQKERLWSRLYLWQIGDNVTCPWEIYGDAKYTFHDPFNHQRSSNTISSPDLCPVISHSLSLSSGVWGVMGRRKVRQRDDHLSLFSVPIIPCCRRALRAKTTGDKSVSSLRSIMRCIAFGHNIYKFICILVNFKSWDKPLSNNSSVNCSY